MGSCIPQRPVVWRSSILQPKRKSSVSGKIARGINKFVVEVLNMKEEKGLFSYFREH